MRTIFYILIFLTFAKSAFAFDHTHATWSEVLKNYQTPSGLIFYRRLKNDIAANKSHSFSVYLQTIQGVKHAEYQKWSKDEKMAFLINAYNALTFKLIVDHYPVSSIKKIGGFFSKPWSIEFFSLLDGKIKALDPIEHEWLRPTYKDFRIHAAVNCASISCPPLRHEAFVASRLNDQLDDQMKLWLKDASRNQISFAEDKMALSKIFDWYESDFTNWGGGVITVVSRYTGTPISDTKKKEIQIKYLPYDWNLNEAN